MAAWSLLGSITSLIWASSMASSNFGTGCVSQNLSAFVCLRIVLDSRSAHPRDELLEFFPSLRFRGQVGAAFFLPLPFFLFSGTGGGARGLVLVGVGAVVSIY